MEETITIPKKKYDELVQRERWLSALEGAGVDNWCGYGIAHELLEEWDIEDAQG